MSNQPNKENDGFDHLIRRKLEEHQADFDPAAWDAMEKKLEGSGNGGGISGMAGRISGLLLVFLILIFSGWWLLKADDQEKSAAAEFSPALSSPAKNTSAQQESLQQQAEENTAAPRESGIKSGMRNKAPSSGPGNTKDAVKDHPAEGFTPGEGQRMSNMKEGSTSSEGSSVAIVEMTDGKEEDQNQQASALRQFPNDRLFSNLDTDARAEGSGSPDDAAPEMLNKGVDAGAKEVFAVPEDSGQEESTDKGIRGVDKKETAAGGITGGIAGGIERRGPEFLYRGDVPLLLPLVPEAEKAEVVEPEPAEDKQEEKVKVKGGFPLSIIAVVSPDFTGTQQKGSIKTGAGAGVFLEYEFLPRWSVLSGVFYSRKNYLASDLFPSYGGGYGEYKPAPDYIDAGCTVIDIPLNLRYYLFNSSRHRIFLSAGASAYLMKREDYTFVYKNSYKYDNYTYSVEGENKHLPAVYNFSVGYQRSLSRHWSLQAEPFYKLPAKGVGAGAVKLNSIGAFVQLKYSLRR